MHFGMLDLQGTFGRRFGGIGAGVPTPSLALEACAAGDVAVTAAPGAAKQSARALEVARRVLQHYGSTAGVRLHLERTIPAHVGLGSGTQLALAVARALAELYDFPRDVVSLAAATGRGQRSAVGTWLFEAGGLVVEGGRRMGSQGAAPLLARLAIPSDWRCVVALPRGASGTSGDDEASAFAGLPSPSDAEAARVSHLVLMALLPALLEDDIGAFGRALTEIQCINGKWFSSAQGGTFAPASAQLIDRMPEWGAVGVGQSSWGPTVYGLVRGDAAAAALSTSVTTYLGDRGDVFTGPFADGGATVRRIEAAAEHRDNRSAETRS